MDRSEKSIFLIFLTVLLAAGFYLVLCSGIFYITRNVLKISPIELLTTQPVTAPTPVSPASSPTIPTTTSDITTAGQVMDTLQLLRQTVIPSANLVTLAEHFQGKENIPLQLTTEPIAYNPGDQLDFYILDVDNNITRRIPAVLRYASDKVYFWSEDGFNLDSAELSNIMREFENTIYPTDQEFFGKEWIPGVDNDPHLFILYASGLGRQLAGYTSTADEVLTEAFKYSNVHEMFYINSDVQWLSDPYTRSVMAHELQHLIHGHLDPNEELWLNEGFSELATLLNGYGAGGFDNFFSHDADVQLNDWSTYPTENDAHYGASFLFVTYLLDRFGEDFTKKVVADPLNGFSSIDHVLEQDNRTDPATGKLITADDLFADWAITNYVDNPAFDDGRYTYHNYPAAPSFSSTEIITSCDGVTLNSSVHQYGTDYLEIQCAEKPVQLHFSGSTSVSIVPVSTGSNKFMWSNRADASATTLTHTFDFTDVSAPITLTYKTWYDLEMDYDYVYLTASENGVNGEVLLTPSCVSTNLTGINYGCGYTGSSNGWITENVDLSNFAGQLITLSFEYITDEAVSGEGFIIDDIRIPEIGYEANFEKDDGGWTTDGFVRIENLIPQTFLVSIINPSGKTPLLKYKLGSGEELNLNLDSLPAGEKYVLVISGTSRFTRNEATYQVVLNQQ